MRRILRGLLQLFLRLFLYLFVAFLALVVLILAAAVVRTATWVVDKMLQTNGHQYLDKFYDTLSSEYLRYRTEYVTQPLWDWADRVGLIGTMDSATEVVTRGIILYLVFLSLGCWFYFLRVVHRIKYAFIELTVAFAAMVYAVNGMAGGVFTGTSTVAFLTGLYVMVRGLQNIDDGIQALVVAEVERGVVGTAHSAHELWKAVFYLPYSKGNWPVRKKSLQRVWSMILKPHLPDKADDKVAIEPTTDAMKQENPKLPLIAAEATQEAASIALLETVSTELQAAITANDQPAMQAIVDSLNAKAASMAAEVAKISPPVAPPVAPVVDPSAP